MIKGREKESVGTGSAKYVGLTNVEVVAINPTRSEANKLLGREDSEDDKEIVYLSSDQEGNKRVRLTFWLWDSGLKRHFVYSFNLTDKVRLNKDGTKTQYVNNTCGTSWADKEENLPEWFCNFQDRKKGNVGKKIVRPALLGEEELSNLLNFWLKMVWRDPSCHVLIDTNKLFGEDYSELRDVIKNGMDNPISALLGVRTDENDSTKQYQQVYRKFLPADFVNSLMTGKFPTEYSKNAWSKFSDEAEGQYGFDCYFELVPVMPYDSNKDVAASVSAKADVTPGNSKY